ncbi:hypothetical protein [Mycolicibacterium vulneris]|uniref:hypothetical protein n=1 Tax=Mycolicibacterium vulneris TaxID=547163 RepID=UPI0013FD61A9|nr:hypothetical protein [Mycolicibacterium vulneris]
MIAYLVMVELAKTASHSEPMRLFGQPRRTREHAHRIHRRAARFSRVGAINA